MILTISIKITGCRSLLKFDKKVVEIGEESLGVKKSLKISKNLENLRNILES